MIKLVAFDWNGTLLSDSNAVFKADNEVLKQIGEKPVSCSDFLKYFDVPVKNYYRGLGLSVKKVEEQSEFISKVFYNSYEQLAEKTRSRSHAKTVLIWLKQNNIPAIIISNHIKERIKIHLKRLHIENYFEEILGNYKFGLAMHERNKKIRLFDFLNHERISPKEILIVGDSIEEVEIAKELGAISIAITQGNVSTKRLKSAKPDYLISDLGNIINIIREINSV